MSLTLICAKRREESDDELLNLLIRSGQLVRGDGRGVEGIIFTHALFGMLGTPPHVLRMSVHLSWCIFLFIPQSSATFAHSSLFSHVSCASLRVRQLGDICPGPHSQHPAHWYTPQSWRMCLGPLHFKQQQAGWQCGCGCCLMWWVRALPYV